MLDPVLASPTYTKKSPKLSLYNPLTHTMRVSNLNMSFPRERHETPLIRAGLSNVGSYGYREMQPQRLSKTLIRQSLANPITGESM